MSLTTRWTTMILVAVCVAQMPASAQAIDSARASVADTTGAAATVVSAPTPAGPRLGATAAAMRHLIRPANALAFQRAQPMSMGKPVALMIVGGTAIVLGAVIGQDVGTLFMIGGSVSVLVGLYQYLK